MALYISKNGERLGPYSSAEVQNFLNAGTLQSSDLAWFEGSPDWTPLAGVPGIVAPLRTHQEKAPSWDRVVLPVPPANRNLLPLFLTAIYLVLAVSSIAIIASPGFPVFPPRFSPIVTSETLAALCLVAGAIRFTLLRRSSLSFGLIGGAFALSAISFLLNFLRLPVLPDADPNGHLMFDTSLILCGLKLLAIGGVAYLARLRSLP